MYFSVTGTRGEVIFPQSVELCGSVEAGIWTGCHSDVHSENAPHTIHRHLHDE